MTGSSHDSPAPNLDALLADLMPAARRLAAARRGRRRVLRIAAVAAAALALAASAAVAGFDILGSPAPPAVRQDLRGLDRGMPADLRLNPDVENARAVAATGDSVVYFARLAGGGYCAELVTRGAVCSTSDGADRTGMSVTVPFTDPVTDDSPVTVSGRVARPHDPIELDTVSTESDLTLVLRVRGSLHVEGVDHLTLRYPDGATVRIEPRGERFDYAVPPRRQGDLMTPGAITAFDRDGTVLAERPVAAVAYWHSGR